MKFLSCDRSTGSCICLRLGLYMSHVLVLCVSVIFCTCDMYKSSLRHDTVLLSQDINYTCNFFFCYFQTSCVSLVQCLTVSSPTYVSIGIVSYILLTISFRYLYRPFLQCETLMRYYTNTQHAYCKPRSEHTY